MRAQSTPAEARLWRLLSGSKLADRKFRRQQSVGPYVVDFYCPTESLVVELDGAAHDGAQRQAGDAARDAWLTAQGLTVLRIENRWVMEDPDAVLAWIAQHFRR